MRETLKEEIDTKKSYVELSEKSKENIKDLIEQKSFKGLYRDEDKLALFVELFKNIKEDYGIEYSEFASSFSTDSSVNYERVKNGSDYTYNSRIHINPSRTDRRMQEEEFVYNDCRYAAINKTCIVRSEYYENLYRLYELLKLAQKHRMAKLAQNNDKLGMYFEDVLYEITERDLLNNKKMSKLTDADKKILSFNRQANAYAARQLCEIFAGENKNDPMGCLNMQSYIMLSNILKSGYGNTKLFGGSKTESPLEKLCKISGIQYDKYKGLDLPFAERIMQGFDVTQEELNSMNAYLFDSSQGKPRGNYETVQKSLKL